MDSRSFSVIAFGPPDHPRTFSGYARSLTTALQARGLLRHQYDIKPNRLQDLARALTLFSGIGPWYRPRISRKWLWSRQGMRVLSRQLERQIRLRGDHGPFLQVGTLVSISPEFGPHCLFTDMTIAQARQAGQFAVSKLSSRQVDEAERNQADLLSTARHVFAISEWTASSLTQDCNVPRDKITVIYAGPNLAIPADPQEKHGNRQILFVGIDWERKGGPLLLEAFQIARRSMPDLVLRIIGCDPRIAGDGILVEGYLSPADPEQRCRLIRCFREATCFCFPTLFDPFPNVLLEAAHAGLPIVAIDNGSRREVVVDGVTGRLATSAEPEAVAHALIEVLSDPTRAAKMGREAQQHAASHFTWDQVVNRIRTAGSILSEPGTAARMA